MSICSCCHPGLHLSPPTTPLHLLLSAADSQPINHQNHSQLTTFLIDYRALSVVRQARDQKKKQKNPASFLSGSDPFCPKRNSLAC